MKYITRGVIGIILCASLNCLTACGQKGPLYLPEDRPNNEPQKKQKHNRPYF